MVSQLDTSWSKCCKSVENDSGRVILGILRSFAHHRRFRPVTVIAEKELKK